MKLHIMNQQVLCHLLAESSMDVKDHVVVVDDNNGNILRHLKNNKMGKMGSKGSSGGDNGGYGYGRSINVNTVAISYQYSIIVTNLAPVPLVVVASVGSSLDDRTKDCWQHANDVNNYKTTNDPYNNCGKCLRGLIFIGSSSVTSKIYNGGLKHCALSDCMGCEVVTLKPLFNCGLVVERKDPLHNRYTCQCTCQCCNRWWNESIIHTRHSIPNSISISISISINISININININNTKQLLVSIFILAPKKIISIIMPFILEVWDHMWWLIMGLTMNTKNVTIMNMVLQYNVVVPEYNLFGHVPVPFKMKVIVIVKAIVNHSHPILYLRSRSRLRLRLRSRAVQTKKKLRKCEHTIL